MSASRSRPSMWCAQRKSSDRSCDVKRHAFHEPETHLLTGAARDIGGIGHYGMLIEKGHKVRALVRREVPLRETSVDVCRE